MEARNMNSIKRLNQIFEIERKASDYGNETRMTTMTTQLY